MLVAGGLVTCESIVLYMNIGEPVIQRWFHTDRGGGGGGIESLAFDGQWRGEAAETFCVDSTIHVQQWHLFVAAAAAAATVTKKNTWTYASGRASKTFARVLTSYQRPRMASSIRPCAARCVVVDSPLRVVTVLVLSVVKPSGRQNSDSRFETNKKHPQGKERQLGLGRGGRRLQRRQWRAFWFS